MAAIRPTIAQRAIWFAHQLDPSQAAYNVAEYTRIDGSFEPWLFEKAATLVLRDAQALHLHVVNRGETLELHAGAEPHWHLDLVDLSAEADPEQAALAAMELDRHVAFDIAAGPLFRWRLYKLSEECWIWFQNYHHLIVDGWAAALITRHVASLYTALLRGEPAPAARIPPLATQSDEAAYLLSADWEEDRSYWRESFRDVPQPPTLSGKAAVSFQDFSRCCIALSKPLKGKLDVCARGLSASKAQLYVAAAAIYMARMTGEYDVVLGFPIAARNGDLERTAVDMRSNIALLRLQTSATMTLAATISLAGERIRSAVRHGRYRYEELRSDLGISGNEDMPYSFSVNLVGFDRPEGFGSAEVSSSNLSIGPFQDLALVIYRDNTTGGAEFRLHGNAERYTDADLHSHLSRYLRLLETMCESSPEAAISTVPLLQPAERALILDTFNQTIPNPDDRCFPALFADQVARTPFAPALVGGGHTLTYAELDARSNQMARFLVAKGIGCERIVTIVLERSVEMIIAILAVLKSGAAYMPADSETPAARLSFMLKDSRAAMLLTTRALNEEIKPPVDLAVCLVDDLATARQISAQPSGPLAEEELAAPQDLQSLAYVIYTSGSTGQPKPIGNTHFGLMNNMGTALAAGFGIEPKDRVLQFASQAFDVAVADMAVTFLRGATLVLVSTAETREPRLLSKLITETGATVASLTPSFVSALQDDTLAGIRTLIVAGEACPPSLVSRFASGRRMINGYGPAEAGYVTLSAPLQPTMDDADDRLSVTIGSPMPGIRIYILDACLQPVPVGVPGELYIAGPGLARGYVRRPSLTADRFIACPFGATGERMYRSGDLARWRADGTLDFLGRIDRQVKIRGFRIELAEIETALCSMPRVGQAAVLVREIAGEKRLSAYLVPALAGIAPKLTEVRATLSQLLPDYMVPSAFVIVDCLPLTINGKLDVARLSEPNVEREVPRIAPRNGTEKLLCGLFAELMGTSQVSVDDNFFFLGGHSLLAMRLIAQVRQATGVELSLRTLFGAPTPRGLAAFLATSTGTPLRLAANIENDDIATIYLRDGTRAPLFCIPPAGGVPTVYIYIALAMQTNTPMIGLEARGLDTDAAPHATTREMAEAYVRTICRYQPFGAPRLLGWSFGGLVALEMAAILERIGRSPEHVILMDSIIDGGVGVSQITILDSIRMFCDVFGCTFQEQALEETKRLLFEEMKTVRIFSDQNGMPFFERFLENFIRAIALSQQWTPTKIRAPILYLRANDNKSAALEASLRRVTSGRIEIIDVDVRHIALCSEANSKTIASHLDRLLAAETA